MRSTVLFLVLLAVALPSFISCSTKCYICDPCPEPFDAKNLAVSVATCNANCFKTKNKLPLATVSRACSTSREVESEVQDKTKQLKSVLYERVIYQCDTDLCNGSNSSLQLPFSQILFTLLISLFAAFKWF